MNKLNANKLVLDSDVISLLDKLLDDEPTKANDLALSTDQMQKIFHAIRRDLENLLNTHQYYLIWSEQQTELVPSLLDYGIPDFLNMQLSHENARLNFCTTLEKIIQRYEPRLKNITISMHEEAELNRSLKFTIEATLIIKPTPILMSFNSTFDPQTHYFSLADQRYVTHG